MIAMAQMRWFGPKSMVRIVLLSALAKIAGIKHRRHGRHGIRQTPASSLAIGMTGNTEPAERIAYTASPSISISSPSARRS